mgnify:CR=1 FL=1
MTDQLQDTLASAYELIESDRLDEARALLKPILAEDIDNADAWWLYVHAVDDPETARTALNNVLRIDHDYPGATALMNTLERAYPSGATTTVTEPDLFAVDAPVSLDLADDLDLGEDDIDLGQELDFPETIEKESAALEAERKQGPNRLMWLLLLIVLIVVIIGLLLLLSTSGAGEQPATVPTAAIDIPTEDSQSFLVPTEAADTTVADEGSLMLETALTGVNVVAESTGIENTSLGQTVLASVCTTAGDELRVALSDSMEAVSQAAAQMDNTADAAGVRLVDCETQTVLRVIAGPLEAAAQYAAGALDRESYEATWRALP